MAITTSGFQLSVLPQPLQVPGNLGVLKPPLDSQEILALAQQHLSALNQARQASVQQEQLGMERQRLASETAARQSALASEAQQRQQRGQLFPSQLQTAQQTAQRNALELPVYQSKAALDLAQNRFALDRVGPTESVTAVEPTERGTFRNTQTVTAGGLPVSRTSTESIMPPGMTAATAKPVSKRLLLSNGSQMDAVFYPATGSYTDIYGKPIAREEIAREDGAPSIGVGMATQEAANIKVETAGNLANVKEDAKLRAIRKKEKPAVTFQLRELEESSSRLNRLIERLKSKVGPNTVGYANLISKLPQADANEVRQLLNTITANVGLDKLMAMKQASANGSSGLGQVTDRENEALRNSIVPLGQDLTGEALLFYLDELQAQRSAAVRNIKQKIADVYEDSEGGAPQSAQSIPTLSPEMRALLEKTLAENPNSPDAPTARAMLGKQ